MMGGFGPKWKSRVWPAQQLVGVRAWSIPKQQGANPRREGTLLEQTATSTPPVACARLVLAANKVGIKPEISNSPLNRVLSWTLFDDKS
jgi:hypothetical protein